VSTAIKTHTPPQQAPANRGRWGWIILFVAAGAAVAGGWYYHTKSIKAATGTAEAAKDSGADQASDEPIPVEVVHVSKGGILRTSAQIGSVQPFQEADLYAKVSGYLKDLHVDYGDHVRRDQLLAEIDDPEIVKRAEKAAADVEQARAAVAQADAFVESAKADRDASASAVDQAVAEVDRYKSMRNYHQKKFARYEELVKSKAIPQQIADEEEENYESARASEVASQKAVLNSRAQLIAAGARVKKAEADVAEAKANLQVAEAKLAEANVLVGYTKITSPYDGVITRRNFFPGAFIRSAAEGGTIPLLNVARIDKVRVVTEVPDRDVPLTDVGDPAEVTLDALGGEVFHGQVSRMADAEDPTSRTMHTEIDLPNSDNRLRPGMYGIAKIILDKSTKNTTLPASALVGESKGGKADVYVIKDGKAKKARIEVGADDGIRVEVLSGLSPNDEVIKDPSSVTEGIPVKPIRQVAGGRAPRRS
jgi:RND family efflux transporter MFP subunit